MNHDVYVLIPGITGSVLQKDGHDVFGLTAQAGLRALFTGGGSIQQLRLTEDPPDVDDLGDGIRAGRWPPTPTSFPDCGKSTATARSAHTCGIGSGCYQAKVTSNSPMTGAATIG